MQQPVSRPWQRPLLLLAQALIAIVFAALTIRATVLLLPPALGDVQHDRADLYFLAAIANLVFIHTLELHSQTSKTWKIILYTAVGSIVISMLMWCAYYFIDIRT